MSEPAARHQIILIGMMGSGKSSVGKALASALAVPFVDMDAAIARRFGRSVSQVFRIYGEDAFREHETSILRSLEPCPGVVATGGGVVLRPANWEEFARLGVTVYLEASLELLLRRLSFGLKRRPLLQTEDWQTRVRALLEERKQYYERADFRFAVDDRPVEVLAADLARALER